MLEQEFESAKQQLLSLMPKYLASKGINIEANFKCLNPEDKAQIPTMTFNSQNCTVNCFHCKCSYNIFDLIGIEYSLPDFSRQFTKAHELFLGKVPLGFIEILKRQSESVFTPVQSQPFEIANDRATNERLVPLHHDSSLPPFGFASANADSFAKPAERRETISFNSVSPFDEARLRPFNTRANPPSNSNGGMFSSQPFAQGGQNVPPPPQAPAPAAQFNQGRAPFGFGDSQNSQSRFGESKNDVFPNFAQESSYDFTDYVNSCAANVDKSTYFKDRGLSDLVIHRFKLGIDEHFQAELDTLAGQRFWKAAIIPYGVHAYCVRNTEDPVNSKNDRYKKKGVFDIYNHEALDQEGTIFITEGEFDALSIETLGYRAVALGGAGNIRMLLDSIKNCTIEHQYYLCLDNDDAGREATRQIANALFQLNKSFKIINLAYPFKDINEALCNARDILSNKIANLEKILSFSMESLKEKAPEVKYLLNAEDTSALALSPALYTISGKPQLLRRFVADIVRARQCALVYAGGRTQWKYLSSFVTANVQSFNEQDFNTLRFLELKDETPVDTQIYQGIESQLVQGNSSFVTAVDLSDQSGQMLTDTLKTLSAFTSANSVAVIALCSLRDQDIAQSISVQDLEVSVSQSGDFVIRTLDEKCRTIEFARPQIQ